MTWLTPDEIDRERWRWRQWKRQHGGWDQPLWIVLQDQWWASLTQNHNR